MLYDKYNKKNKLYKFCKQLKSQTQIKFTLEVEM